MKDWNAIVTIDQEGYRRAIRALRTIGPTERTPYYNVLVMKVDQPMAALEAIERLTEERPPLYDAIARVAPATFLFEFDSAEGFKERAINIMQVWSPGLVGRSFHLRLHHRGLKFDLRSQDAERLFNDAVVAATAKLGTPARITFEDPDAVIVLDTIDDRAGIAMWTREDLARHWLLRPD